MANARPSVNTVWAPRRTKVKLWIWTFWFSNRHQTLTSNQFEVKVMVSQFWWSSGDALEWVRWYTFSKDAIANIGRNLQTHFCSSHHPIFGVMHFLLTKQVVLKYSKPLTKVCEEKACFFFSSTFHLVNHLLIQVPCISAFTKLGGWLQYF